MSYQVLARKWRPRNFREMVGQEHVLQALINALDHDRLHHAYLFTGTRGVGKTTIARILAKCLNCDQGVSSEPCGTCGSCLEIAEGRSVDLLEVDAASRTKVEDTRELLDNVQYAPTRSRYKVYLIDEVHMLSGHSFNALLKTLEEPPPHVKFLLATTDPQKLPATILSRCLQFNLKNMPPEQIVSHLQYVLGQEMVSFEEPALWQLGRAASGSMRDALSLTDQAIAFGSGKLLEAEVRTMLGTVDLSFVYQLLEAVVAGEPAAVLAVVAQMGEHAPDFEGSLDELISLVHRVAMAQAVPDAIDNNWGDAERIAALARSITAEDAQLFYQIAINGKRDLGLATEPRSGFEMLALRMIAFRPQAVLDESLTPGDIVEVPAQQAAAVAPEVDHPLKKPREAPRGAPQSTSVESGPAPVATLAPSSQAERVATTSSAQAGGAPSGLAQEVALPHSEPVVAPVVVEATPPALSSVPDTPADSGTSTPAKIDAIGLHEFSAARWPEVLEHIGLAGMVYNIASHCSLQGVEGTALSFVLDSNNAGLFNASHIGKIRKGLEEYFGQQLAVDIVAGEVTGETPAMNQARLIAQRQAEAVTEIEQDPLLQRFITRFDGQLDGASIAPRKH